jgi:hypothetical protein
MLSKPKSELPECIESQTDSVTKNVLADYSVNCAPVEQLLSVPRMMRATDGTQILNVSPVSCKSNNVCKSNVQQNKDIHIPQ